MRFLDLMILLVLFIILGAGIYMLWLNLPGETLNFEKYELDKEDFEFSNNTQFYPNMRYRDREISYYISSSCDSKRRSDVVRAFSIISEKTVLTFNDAGNIADAEINILCSDIAPEPEEEGHFVAGEGGPSEVINTTIFAVILSGKVSLYRQNDCDNPNVAIHEILHALGFEHNDNLNSIMYPLTKCSQDIDRYIVDEINSLYKIDSAPDLVIEQVTAERSGRYLSFELIAGNFGLRDSGESQIEVFADEEYISSFHLEQVGIGTKRILTVKNLRVSRNTQDISFKIDYDLPELDKDNNAVDVRLIAV